MNDPILAVIDTNVVVAGLYTKNPMSPTVQILNFIGQRLIQPVIHKLIIEEYFEVLNRPKFNFDVKLVDNFLKDFAELGVWLDPVHFDGEMPDPKDRIFYEVSLANESFLVTGNLKHFPISPKVVSPAFMVDLVLRYYF